jgi:hypothetical protein
MSIDVPICSRRMAVARASPPRPSADEEAVFGDGLRLRLVSAPAAGGEEPAEPLSPELVLVDPELRARALEALPVRDPDALVPARAVSDPATTASRTTTVVGALAYAAQRSVSFAVEGAIVVGCVAGIALFVNWLR